ncbi:BOS complex subunit NOMO1-like isoform X2 [Littorina saxatilis]|uniref:Nodal modulator 1 n=1 Tax=Littorina saxatilis TaxID=31220 RepID=A0AAN9BJK4_9CAEN
MSKMMEAGSAVRLFFFLSTIFRPVLLQGDGVLGCGGFVKSDVDINFSLVEVKLYTPHGSIKYQTDCAPNTGYYLIPLYDKGDYILKVEPPAGWSFEPTSIDLHVDGTTDKCSLGEDINFKFTGFSVTGKVVSEGQTEGPEGVSLSLVETRSQAVQQTVHTSVGGSYTITGVMPGEYTVKASHPKWKFNKAETRVKVVDDNVNAGNALSVAGYDVKGQVFSEGEPMKGVNFVLFSANGKKPAVGGCDKALPKGYPSASQQPLCHVTSQADGSFVFTTIPTGQYYLVPFYKGEHITFDVEPEKLDFEVTHDSVAFEKNFEVAGFSVSGRVVESNQGVGIAKATVLINGVTTTTTDTTGTYHLENMKTGTYTLSVTADNIFFPENTVKITPNTPQLPDIVATDFNVCGKVTIDRIPESLGAVTSQRRIIYSPEGKGSEAVSKVTDADGKFCVKVKPGKYNFNVYLSDGEKEAGLHLAPGHRQVAVGNKPVMDVNFSQFRAKVSGAISCMEKCGELEVSLNAVGRQDAKVLAKAKETGATSASFIFENVLPGKYKATIVQDSWCWKSKTVDLEVGEGDVTGVSFTHNGYILKCSISHPITLNFAHEKKSGTVGSFQLNKGTNRFCLAQAGVYQLTPDSCHKFEQEVYSYDTANPVALTLTAIQHIATGTVKTEEKVADITVTIKSSVEDTATVIGPLSLSSGGAKDKGPFTYTFSHWAKAGEKLEISVKSKEVLFYPAKKEVTIDGESCPGEVASFTGRKGVFMTGEVQPPLEGVTITVTSEDGSMDPVLLTTEASGKYRVGPLHGDVKYSVAAEKTGYVITPDASKKDVFRAFKLGEISVKVLDKQGQPMPGVLLSLSGERQYRSNNITGDTGTLVFTSLSPGQYYLRPMTKEYKFEPQSQSITVEEGTTMNIVISGTRVAYSVYGKVTSLNGEPEAGVVVEAVGEGQGCEQFQEEAKTEQDGSYRIRGLQPKCQYDVHLKTGQVNTHIERAGPKSRIIKVADKDFTDINIIAFRRMNQMDISGNVMTPEEHLPHLKARLYREDAPDSPVHTISLGRSTFFYFPTLQMDNVKYTLRLECTLPKSQYDFVDPEVSFTANISFKHYKFSFEPKRKMVDQELSPGSFLILPVVAIIILALYNYQTVLPMALQMVGQVQAFAQHQQQQQQQQRQQQHHSGDTEPFMEQNSAESSPARKRPKARKAQ